MHPNKGPNPPPDHTESESAVESVDRLFALLDEVNATKEEKEPETYDGKAPELVKSGLAARQKEYEQAWESEAAKSTPQTDDQIREKLAKRGLYPEPPTGEEVVLLEQQRLAALREEARVAKPVDTKSHRIVQNGRTNASLRPAIRALPGYDKQRDPSNPDN